MSLKRLTVATSAVLLLSGGLAACVTAPSASQARAPQPAKTVDLNRLYSGKWLEIARLPMKLTDGCVAGSTSYTVVNPTRIDVRDTCQAKTPQGKERALGARGEILDPGTNGKLRVRYFAGFVTWDFWILDHAEDYSWFISADPTFDRLWIYTRQVPNAAERQRLVARVQALGYDSSRLEFPAF